MSYDCFLSYAAADVRTAEALCGRLTAEGFSVWFDKVRLQPGFDWHREIEAACEASRIVLPILTPRWSRSEWTKYETYGAEAIIPLVAEGRFEDVTAPPLRRVQASAITLSADETDAPKLVAAIRARLAEPALDGAERQRRMAHLRYRPTTVFVGRERDLERLHEQLHVAPTTALTQGRVQAIAALGGVGKTTMARMYAEKFWRTYQVILWVDARLGYESEFSRLIDVLRPDLTVGLRGVPDAERAARTRQEIEALTATRPLMTAGLLILDNAEDEATTAAWMPRTGQVHTIITSRYRHWEAVPIYPIAVLEPEPARALLLRRSGQADTGDVPEAEIVACDALAKKLGYLPLALEQAAAYIRTQGIGFLFTDYLRLYADGERALLSVPVRGTTEYPVPVFVTWQATVAKLPAEARAMLRLAAFLAPTEIPLGLFQDGIDAIVDLAREFDSAPADARAVPPPNAELSVRQWRAALADYSMVQTPSGDTLAVHSLVQAVERGQLEGDARRRWLRAAMEVFATHAPQAAFQFEHWPAWRTLLPHAQALVAGATVAGVAPAPTALLHGLSNFLVGQGRNAEARPLAEQVVQQSEVQVGPEHHDTLIGVNNLASLLQARGEYAAAAPLFRRALDARERVLGPEHPDTLTSVSNLAGLLQAKGEYAAAAPLYRRALDGYGRLLGPEHPDTLRSVNNLGSLLQTQGDNAAAEPLYRRALDGYERLLGAEHPDTLNSVSNLAGLLQSKGDYAAAAPLYCRALDTSERILGPEHPDTLRSVNNLASLLQAQGDYAAASPLFRRALDGDERVLGPEHPDTLSSVNNLAELLRAQGDYAAAAPLYLRALDARERVLGPEHPDTLSSVNNLALLLDAQRDYAAAAPLYRRALDSYERVLGPEHPDTLTSVNNLATLLQKQGDYATATALHRRALDTSERVLGPEHPQTLTSVNNLAGLLQRQGDYAAAAPLYRRALEASDRVLGPEHPHTLFSAHNLAYLLQQQGDYTAAAPLYRRALDASERVLGPEHPTTRIVRANWERCRSQL